MPKTNKKPRSKTKQAETPVSLAAARLDALRQSIAKKYGDGTIIPLDSVSDIPFFDTQTPTGSISLDRALGVMRRLENGVWQTGLPRKRIVEVFGAESSGKTTLLAQIIANAQAQGHRCAMIDMEHAVDPAYWCRLGVNFGLLDFMQPNTGEQALELVEAMVSSGLYAFIGVDSIAALVPQDEAEDEMGKAQMGSHARLMSQALRKINPRLRDGNCTVVFTNQIRSKLGGWGGTETPGGRAMKFYANIRIRVWQDEKIKVGDQQVGHYMGLEVVKNKIAPPYQKGRATLIYGKGFEPVSELFDVCVEAQVINQAGAWFSVDGEQLGQGRENAIGTLFNRRDLCYQIYDRLLGKSLIQQGFNADGTPIPGFERPKTGTVVETFAPVGQPEDPEFEGLDMVVAA